MKKVDALGKYTSISHASLLEDRSGCSKKQIPVSSSSLELRPSYYAPLNPKCTQRVHHLRHIHLQLARCRRSDSDPGEGSASNAEAKWLLLGQISQTRVLSLEISLHWDSFPGLGHHVLCMFLQKASSGTVCDLMCTALKGTWEGQCTQYTALLKGQIHIAPSTLVLNSKSHLPKINCCSISCLKTKPQPLGDAPSQSKSRDHC